MTWSPWKVQHGKPREACSLGRINHSREQTLYLIKRTNQSQINFNKLQGQTTKWVYADVLLLQILMKIQGKKAFILRNHAITAHVNVKVKVVPTQGLSEWVCCGAPGTMDDLQWLRQRKWEITKRSQQSAGIQKKGWRALLALMLRCIM